MRHIFEAMGFAFVSVPLSYPAVCCRRGNVLVTNSACNAEDVDAALQKAFMRLLTTSSPTSCVETSNTAVRR